MEFEVVSVKVPKGMLPEGYELIVCAPDAGDIILSGSIAWSGCSLVARRKLLKPDWNPPKLKKGWVTWDGAGEWCWWDRRPKHSDASKWHTLERGVKVEAITGVMAEFLGCPCCDGFDERECIWEVGE